MKAKNLEGIIIRQNDTVLVTFNIPTNTFSTEPDYLRLQRSILYYDNNGKKKKIKPYEAKEVQFEFNGFLVRMISMKMSRKINISSPIDSVMFLHLEEDGYVKLFSYYLATMTKANSIMYLIKKGESEIMWVYAFSTKKVKEKLTAYLSDCNPAVELINESNAFKFDIFAIVNKYNNSCKRE